MTTIYALTDPRDGRVRYVGRTTLPLRRRLGCHIDWSRAGRSDTPKTCWIRELLALGLRPGLVSLGEVEDGQADAAEREAIAAHGPGLTNTRLVSNRRAS